MGLWDTADLLARAQRYAQRPDVDESMADSDWYALLTEAQADWVRQIAVFCPSAMFSAPVKMVSADGGFTYSVPGITRTPYAMVITAARTGYPLVPGQDGEPCDYVVEADGVIRVPGGLSRSFADGPYARYIEEPGEIAADVEPTLKPASARILLVWEALERWAAQPSSPADPTYFAREKQKAWTGDPTVGTAGILGALRTQHFYDGLQTQAAVWWRSSDLGHNG